MRIDQKPFFGLCRTLEQHCRPWSLFGGLFCFILHAMLPAFFSFGIRFQLLTGVHDIMESWLCVYGTWPPILWPLCCFLFKGLTRQVDDRPADT